MTFVPPTNVSGWDSVIATNLFQGVFELYTANFGLWFVFVLFMVFQLMLYLKTRNMAMMHTLTALFAVYFAVSEAFIPSIGSSIIMVILIFYFAGLFFWVFFK